jgi:hypothetical protein
MLKRNESKGRRTGRRLQIHIADLSVLPEQILHVFAPYIERETADIDSRHLAADLQIPDVSKPNFTATHPSAICPKPDIFESSLRPGLDPGLGRRRSESIPPARHAPRRQVMNSGGLKTFKVESMPPGEPQLQ